MRQFSFASNNVYQYFSMRKRLLATT
jgi:hypothetical protein